MAYSDKELSNMINNILNGVDINEPVGYVDQKQREFISSLQNMVEDRDAALRNYRNLI